MRSRSDLEPRVLADAEPRWRARPLIAAGVALAAGAALYLGRGVTRGEEWLGIAPTSNAVRAALGSTVRALPAWVRDAGPDAAWSFALGTTLGVVAPPGRAGLAWRAAGLALALGYELGQGLGLVRGTFDVRDLVAIAIFYSLAMLFTRDTPRKQGKQA